MGTWRHRYAPWNHPDHLRLGAVPADRTRQIHQAATLGIGRKAVLDGPPDAVAHRDIFRQRFHCRFRKAAADKQAIQVGERQIPDHVEPDEFDAVAKKTLEIVGVVKAEGLVSGDADPQRSIQREHFRRRRCYRRIGAAGRPRQRNDPVQVHMITNRIGKASDCLVCRPIFLRRDETQMALLDHFAPEAGNRAQYRDIGVLLDGLDQFRLMARPTHPVQNDSAYPYLGVEVLISNQQWRNPPRHSHGVDHQHDRHIEQLRQGGIAVAAVDVHTVIQTLVALDDGNVRPAVA